MLLQQFLSFGALTSNKAVGFFPETSIDCQPTVTSIPQYFQTSPELWAGPTETGLAPFLAQTNPASFAPSATFIPNTPLETVIPIADGKKNKNIFQLMGHLSPYFPNQDGFGVQEYPLPSGAKISQVQVNIPNSSGTLNLIQNL